jgi:prepilin-type processing-associated H-X9-DG protein
VLSSTSTVAIAADAKTSGLAITSLVLFILAFFTLGLTVLPAIIFGIIALVKIEKSGGKLKGKGLAITGIAAPAALVPIALMMAILMPALFRVRCLANQMVCGTRMAGLGKAMMLYASDNDEKFPTGSQWCDLLIKYADVSPQQFVCESAKIGPCNFAMNENAARLGLNSPPNMVLLFESEPGWNLVGGAELLTTENHLGNGCNVLFGDFSVRFIRADELYQLQWTEESQDWAY